MERRWISLDAIARSRRITLAQASALADARHWPKVFRLHETVVLAPRDVIA